MKNLDCHTKRGRKFIAAQHDTTKILKRIFPSLIFVHSVNATQAEDCYIYCNKILSGVAEIKCREFINRRTQLPYKLDTIRKQYDNEYLITKTKVDNLRMISEQKKIPSFIFLNLPAEKKIVRFKITNENGDLVTPIQSRTTRTMYSCNDYKGTTQRENAFLPLDNKNVMLISY